MTDKEIKKALKLCVKNDCSECPIDKVEGEWCETTLVRYALDLINRQEEEKKNLEVELQAMRNAANGFKAEVERLKNLDMQVEVSRKLEAEIKAEAYKEFAERLDKEFSGVGTCNYGYIHHKTRKVLNELVG